MSVSNISSSFSSYQASNHQHRPKEFDELSKALESGDVSAAQQAFAQIQQHAPGGAQGSSTSCGSDGVIADISALGKALSSSDLTSAQSAFSQLQDDIQNSPPPPPPPGGSGGPGGAGGNDAVQQAFADLAEALESGDLEAAQTAFDTLQSFAPDNASTTTTADTTSTTSDSSSTSSTSDGIASDMSALQEALQSGDLDSAQSLFETLLADLQANAPKHPGMHHYQYRESSSSSVSTSA